MTPDQMDAMVLAVRASDVAEATADALLAATSQALVMAVLAGDDTLDEPTPGAVRALAITFLDRVITRTMVEGPRPG